MRCAKQNFVNPDTATLFDPEISQPVRTLGEALIAADHFETHLEVTAERRLLRRLEAGCAAPIGAYATVKDGDLVLTAVVASPDGTEACATRLPPVSLMFPALNDWVFALPKTVLQMGAAALAGLEVK